MMKREALAKKILVLGIDGMDPRLTRRFVDEGAMPNTAQFLQRGASRQDLAMLGAHPTVTPPMWTTLATGAYPCTHGITCFWRQSKQQLDMLEYNLDSRLCQAEQLWNVFVEAGQKTLVWHWPGSSWPPTSDSPLLHVVDGTHPSAVGTPSATVDGEFILTANVKIQELLYRSKAASDSNVPCVIDDLIPEQEYTDLGAMAFSREGSVNIILSEMDGEASMTDNPYDVVMSPIKEAVNWVNAPKGAKEFTILLSHGLVHMPALILCNESGVYDRIALYNSKKEMEPAYILDTDVFYDRLHVKAMTDDGPVDSQRNMRVLTLDDKGEKLTMWIGAAQVAGQDMVWHPKSLYQEVTDNFGIPPSTSMLGGADRRLIVDCMGASWDRHLDWQADVLNYFMDEKDYQVIFSHFHNVDAQGHMIAKYLKKGHNSLTAADYQEMLKRVYVQTDRYIGRFLEQLDKGWTIVIVSDHAQVCPDYEPPLLSETSGVNVRVMEELGFTHIKYDAAGNELKEIDWERTKAVATRANHIYLNIKGRDPQGIVEPEDRYEVEEEIMTALYGYRHKESGKRVIACALRNKDAYLLGMGGPECGDIIYWLAEGYNFDHADSLGTTYGCAGTSVSPIFMAAGAGIKENFVTDRLIREVDVAPTVAVLGGVRMPAQCEGAPVYQILSEQY